MRKLLKTVLLLAVAACLIQLAGCSNAESNKDVQKKSHPQVTAVSKTAQPASEKTIIAETPKKSLIAETPKNSLVINKPHASPAKKEAPKKIVQPTKTTSVKNPVKTNPVILKKQQQTLPLHTVNLSIKGPKDRGMILKPTMVVFKKGDTALKVLLQATKQHHIDVDYSGSGASAYINGIDNVYEFDYGSKSGWVGKLNGKSLTKSADAILVKDGDQLEFFYTQ